MHSSIKFAVLFSVGIMMSITAYAEPSAFDKQMQVVLGEYLKVEDALSSDSLDGVKQAASRIARSASQLSLEAIPSEHRGHYKNLPSKLKKAATELADAGDIESARAAFKTLSKPMAMWASNSNPTGVAVVYCSMANGSWLQNDGEIRNPYYGAKMLNCGEIVSSGTMHHQKHAQGQHMGAQQHGSH